MVAAAKATALSFVGVALETVPGTAVAATNFIPVTKFDPMDHQIWLDDVGWRGAMATEYDQVAGVVHSEIGISGDVYGDSLGWLVAGILGDVTVTGASAPFSHTCSLLNSGDGQPPSYTFHDFYGRTDSNPARKYAGCKVGSLALKGAAEQLLTYDAQLYGFASAVEAKPTASFSTVQAEPSWDGTCTIGGSAKAYLEAFDLRLTRAGAGPVFNIDGTADPYNIWLGRLEVNGALTFILEDDTELNRYVGASKASTSLVLDFTHGAGAALVEEKFTMSQVQYVSPTKIERGKEYVEVTATFKAVANTTDVGASGGYSPIKALLKNALPSGTFK